MSKIYHKGIDSFYTSPGECKEKLCRACGAKTKAQRNVKGPTCFGEAVAHRESLHDYFCCPNTGKVWHDKVVALLEEKEQTVSTKIAKILQEEIDELLDMGEILSCWGR